MKKSRRAVDISSASENVIKICDGDWDWYIKADLQELKQANITGKYLFFSPDRRLLEEIVIDEIENHGFRKGKIPMEGKNKGDDYVLCLYYEDDRRKKELDERHKNNSMVNYRYWKTDEATHAGEYSEAFLSKLTPEEREKLTKKTRARRG